MRATTTATATATRLVEVGQSEEWSSVGEACGGAVRWENGRWASELKVRHNRDKQWVHRLEIIEAGGEGKVGRVESTNVGWVV